MLHTFLLTFCLVVCARSDSVEERLNALERIVELQSLSISSLKHENSELKSHVKHLVKDITRLSDIVERENTKVSLPSHSSYINNETDKNVDTSETEETFKGQNGLVPEIDTINNTLNGRISRRLLGQTGGVAFHVYLTANRCYNDHQVIDYDGEELDLGNGYNEHDGIYVVPVAGVYVFTWTFLVNNAEYAVTEIVVNGVQKGWMISDNTSQDILLSPSTNLIISHVNAGDHVFIRRVEGRGCTALSNKYGRPSFSGWRLTP